MKRLLSVLLVVLSLGTTAATASADSDRAYTGSRSYAPPMDESAAWSPEGFALQLGVGVYRPDPGDAVFDSIYSGDNGPLLSLEFDFLIYRIPYIGPFGLGVSGGWAKYSGSACALNGGGGSCSPTNESTKFSIFPVTPLFVLRIDGLARHTPLPLVFMGKVGYDSVFFIEKVGGDKSSGRTHGFRWGANVALELNFINTRRARALDDDWGINSSYIFVEVGGSDANSRVQLGDKVFWFAGLGLTF